MKFDKTQKRALVFVAGLLGLSWYMGGQFEKADMMRSEGKRPCCSKPSMFFTMRGLSCRNCSKEDRIYRPAKEDMFNQMRSEAEGNEKLLEQIKNDMKSFLNKLSKKEYVRHPRITIKTGSIYDVELKGTGIGSWEVADDEAYRDDKEIWDKESYEFYVNLFEEWAKGYNWYEQVNLEIDTGDKNSAYFWITLKPLTQPKRKSMDWISYAGWGAESFDAESFEDFKRKMVGDDAVAGDVGYMEALEEFYEEYLEDFERITDEFSPEPETFEEFQERVLKNDYEMSLEAETMTPSEVKVKVTKDVTPKGSKIIVEECVDIQAHKADATANFYRVRFRDPAEMSNFRVPAWAARAANTMGSKYYDVAGCKVTMGQDKSGNWKIQSVMVPKRANVDVDLALKIANHIQDRLEKEGKWAPKKCQDNERVLVIR